MPIHHKMLGKRPVDTERIFAQFAGLEQGAESFSAFENVLLAGAVIPLHMHPVEELLVCLAGEAECSINGEEPQRYTAGSILIVPANTPHTIRNIGGGEMRQLSFFAVPSQETVWLEPKGSVK